MSCIRTRSQWKREFLDKAPEIFSKGETAQKTERDCLLEYEQRYKTIGQLKVGVDWLKKNCTRKLFI